MGNAMHLLNKLQEYQFAALEVGLYLDTHPTDPAAQQELQKYKYEIMRLKPEVEKYFGPLTHQSLTGNPERWIYEPWPWEINY